MLTCDSPHFQSTYQVRYESSLFVLFIVLIHVKNDPQHLSGFVRRILYQFIGPN